MKEWRMVGPWVARMAAQSVGQKVSLMAGLWADPMEAMKADLSEVHWAVRLAVNLAGPTVWKSAAWKAVLSVATTGANLAERSAVMTVVQLAVMSGVH